MAGGNALSLLTLVAFFCCNPAIHLTDEGDVTDRETAEPREFCSHETFNASCQPNEVIMVQAAHYGRVRLGRCVKIALGFLGCKKNVRHVLETRCSGRRQCSLLVADVQLRSTVPCPTDVTWHLEVSYVCQRVLAPNESLCGADAVRLPSSQHQQQQQTFFSASSGYIASIISTETQYGRDRCPWTLSVAPGQRIQLRLVVFQSLSTRDPKFSNACVELGAVQDEGRRNPLMLCGWDSMAPNRKLYDSETNHVALTLSLLGPSDIYVIHYRAIGCPLFPLPLRSWSQRMGDKLVIRCNDTEEMWSLVCRQPNWMGSTGNCSTPERIVEWRQETTTPPDTQLPMSKGVNNNVIIVINILIIVAITFISGISCFERNFSKLLNPFKAKVALTQRKV